MNRLREWLAVQMQASPMAKVGLALLGVLILIYFLFPPKRKTATKPQNAQAKSQLGDKLRREQNAVREVQGTPPPNRREKATPPTPPASPQASPLEESLNTPVSLNSLSLGASFSSRGERPDPFAPLVHEPVASAAQTVPPKMPANTPQVRLPRLPPLPGGLPPLPPAPAGKKVVVRGVIIDEHPVVFLQVAGEDLALGEGESAGDVEVLKISRKGVILRVNNQVRTLALPK